MRFKLLADGGWSPNSRDLSTNSGQRLLPGTVPIRFELAELAQGFPQFFTHFIDVLFLTDEWRRHQAGITRSL